MITIIVITIMTTELSVSSPSYSTSSLKLLSSSSLDHNHHHHQLDYHIIMFIIIIMIIILLLKVGEHVDGSVAFDDTPTESRVPLGAKLIDSRVSF